MDIFDRKTLTDRNITDKYRLDIDNFSSSSIKECEVKPCRQIIMLRYPK